MQMVLSCPLTGGLVSVYLENACHGLFLLHYRRGQDSIVFKILANLPLAFVPHSLWGMTSVIVGGRPPVLSVPPCLLSQSLARISFNGVFSRIS
jgi:hypothetical protein